MVLDCSAVAVVSSIRAETDDALDGSAVSVVLPMVSDTPLTEDEEILVAVGEALLD